MLKAFYESVLPAEGQYCLWQKVSGPQWHTWCPTIDALVAETEKRIDTQGLYFGTAAFGDMVQDNPDKAGYGEIVRKGENVRALKAFRIDIDAGDEKFAKHPNDAYPTQRDALAALIAAIKADLPMPTLIVSSGEGLHVYWCLYTELAPEAWKPAALHLNAVCRANGLKVDSGCTADTARVLRPVGTLHKNGSRVTVLRDTGTVWVADSLVDLLRYMAPEETIDLPARPAAKAPSINDDVLHVEGPPASLARVAEHCSAVASMRDSEGNVPEPLWRAVMGVAKYCEDGEALVHEWSAGHPDYSARETQDKFDRWETPPTTCQHFSLMHSGCNTCQYRGKITTPKQVGYIAVAPTPAPQIPDAEEDTGMGMEDDAPADATPECPVPDRPDLFDEGANYFYKVADNRWTLYHRFQEPEKDKTGQVVFVTKIKPVAYKLVWVDSNSLPGATESGGVLVQFGRVQRPGSVRQDRIDMPAGIAADARTLTKYLVDQGVNLAPGSVNKKASEHLQDYIRGELIRKQNDMRFVIKDRFGYHFHEGQFLCSMGQFTVYPDGTILKTICNSKLNGLASSLMTNALPPSPGGKWEPAVWREIAPAVTEYVQFLRTHYGRAGFEPARLSLAINLASPFLVFAADSAFKDAEDLPATGFVLSMYSEASGIGKSSLMAAIAAAYGKDTLARKGNDASITTVAAATTAKNTAIYPFLLDEVTQNEAQRAAALIDTFANGSGRVRAKSDGSVSKSAETWALVSTLATNVPQRELLTASQKRSDALLMRLLELNFDGVPMDGDQEAFRSGLKRVQGNCGAFGLFQALLAVKAGPQKLAEMTAANVTQAYELLGVGQQFRFFVRMLAAVMTNQQLLGRWAPFDLDDIVATFKKALKDTTWYVKEHRLTPEGELGAMLSDLSPSIAVTKSWTRRTAKGEAVSDVLLNPHVRLPLVGREVQDWGCVLIDSKALRQWCMQQQTSVGALIRKLEAAGLLVREEGKDSTKQRLNTGLLGMPSTMGYYYKFRTRAADAASDSGGNVVELRPTDPAPESTTQEMTA